MFRMKPLAATALAAVLATAAHAEVDRIAKIDVAVDLGAIGNEQAATFWADLEADLENAIAARVTDRLVSEEEALTTTSGNDSETPIIDGTQILIDIREVELASALERELNLGDAVLVGDVNIKDETDGSNADLYELSVTLQNANVILPEGTTLVLSTDTSQAYTRLVEAFADGVVTRLK